MSSFNLPPAVEGVRHRQENTKIEIYGEEYGPGTLYIAESHLSWVMDGKEQHTLSVNYPDITTIMGHNITFSKHGAWLSIFVNRYIDLPWFKSCSSRETCNEEDEEIEEEDKKGMQEDKEIIEEKDNKRMQEKDKKKIDKENSKGKLQKDQERVEEEDEELTDESDDEFMDEELLDEEEFTGDDYDWMEGTQVKLIPIDRLAIHPMSDALEQCRDLYPWPSDDEWLEEELEEEETSDEEEPQNNMAAGMEDPAVVGG